MSELDKLIIRLSTALSFLDKELMAARERIAQLEAEVKKEPVNADK